MVPIVTSYNRFDAHAVCVIKGLGEVEVEGGRGYWMVVENTRFHSDCTVGRISGFAANHGHMFTVSAVSRKQSDLGQKQTITRTLRCYEYIQSF